MRLCMFSPREMDIERGWPGRIEGDRVIQLAAQTLQSFFTGGGRAREHAEYPLADVVLRAPVLRPPSVRDFYAFEQHVKTAREKRGPEVPAEWYEQPVFYFSNPAAIYGPDDEIPYPEPSDELDYELEVAAIVGCRRRDRRVHGDERLVGARPPARRDDGRPRPGEGQGLRDVARPGRRHAGRVRRIERDDGRARVNGEERSRGELGDMHFSWERIVEHAARNTRLRPRATCSARGRSGRAASSSSATAAGSQPGDVVELEVEGIGVLRNTVGPRG